MPAIDRLLGTLGHSLWQAIVIALALWALLAILPARAARLRYAATLGAMAAVVFAAAATWRLLDAPPASTAAVPHAMAFAPAAQGEPSASSDAPIASSAARRSNASIDPAPALAALWAVGVVAMLVRLSAGLAGAGRLAASSVPIELPSLAAIAERLNVTARVRSVAAGLAVPCVVGLWRPVVLVPAALLTSLPPAQLELILAHELAHVRRLDPLVNVVQGVVEALLFFNPAVWWIGRQVRQEREACCDALAISTTGDAASLAAALANVAAGASAPLIALAATGGTLVDRVRRLLRPTLRPRVAFPAGSIVLGLGASALVLVTLGGTAQLTVMAAERVLSGGERTEQIAKLQETIAPDTDAAKATLRPLTGRITTSDGKLIPRQTYVQVYYQAGHSSTASTADVDEDGRFKAQAAGVVSVSVTVPGYAPAFSEPIRAGADGAFAPVELVVSPGFPATFRVIDANGHPVAGARIAGYFERPGGGGGFYLRDDAWSPGPTTGDDGVIALAHAAEQPFKGRVDCAGYQFATLDVTPRPDGGTIEIRLAPARTASGVVVDAATLEPIPNATLKCVRRVGVAEGSWMPGQADATLARCDAVADASGRFTLPGLNDGATYAYLVNAPGHGSELVENVKPDADGLTFRLGPSRDVSVEVRGATTPLPKTAALGMRITYGGNSTSSGVDRALPITAGADGVPRIEVRDPLPGKIVLSVAGKRLTIDPSKDRPPYVLDLTPAAPAPQREVVVRFVAPDGGAPPTGKVRFDHIEPGEPNSYKFGEVDIVDGVARKTVPVPTKVLIDQGRVVGYAIERKSEVAVGAGDGPFTLDVNVRPAGAIHGTVRDADGSPFTKYFYATLEVDTRPPGVEHVSVDGFNANSGTPTYLLSPVPIGGTYRVIATAGARVAVSEPVDLSGAAPVREVPLRFREGATLAGVVRGADGAPAAGVNVELLMNPTPSHSSSASARTDAEGRFAFEHVDAKAATYALRIKASAAGQALRVQNVDVGGAPIELRLVAGHTFRGRLVDVDTGLPFRNTRVSAQPMQYGGDGDVETTTDGDGRFTFEGLSPIDYRMPGGGDHYPAESVVNRDAAGKVAGITMHGWDKAAFRGDQSGVVEIKRRASPWKR